VTAESSNWGKRYPAAVPVWREAWKRYLPYPKCPHDLTVDLDHHGDLSHDLGHFDTPTYCGRRDPPGVTGGVHPAELAGARVSRRARGPSATDLLAPALAPLVGSPDLVVIDTPLVDTTLRGWPGGAARSLPARGRWSRPPRVGRAARGAEGTGRAVFAPLPVVTIVCADAPAPGRPSIPHTPEGVLSNAVQRGWPYLFSRRSTVTSLINLS
jgi:hypothetical protein